MTKLTGPRVAPLHNEIVQAIPCEQAKYRADLSALSIGAVATVYVNWADRFVPRRPRRVVYLDGFWGTDLAWRYRDAVLELEKKVVAGVDLTLHLSSQVDFRGFSPSRYDSNGLLISSKWRDKDFALNAFNVHHLHFKERPGRSKELLFVEFTRDVAVFVMVGDHESFDGPELEGRIVEARARNGHELKGIMAPTSGGYTATERNELARAGISTMAVVDGKVVISASVSTAGTSDYTSMHAARILRAIAATDQKLDDAQWVANIFSQSGIAMPEAPKMEWLLNYTNLVLIERRAQTAFPIVEGRRGLPAQLAV
ncbi:MAG: hypothetical protein AB7J30_00380 [Hyphomicrobium sp.]|uniref:hypothetical protein n=1 Tax=Hyphomicrobium sp. TaxID=82 RepID=UPI003D12875E